MRYLIVALFVLIFAGCEKEKIKVGLVIGLSGSYSDISKQVKNGVELAVDEINKKGGIDGKEISLVIKDNKGDVELTKQIDRELIDSKIPVVIGHITSTLSKSAVGLFNNSNTILFSPTTSTTELSHIDDNFIRVQPAKDFNTIKKLIDYIAKDNKNINIIYDINNESYAKSIINAIKSSNLLTINHSIGFKNSGLDYKFLIENRLKNSPLFIISSTKDGANIVKNLRINGFKSLITVSGSSFSQKFIDLAGEYAEGTVFVTDFNSLAQRKKFLKFKRDFIAKFGYSPSSFEANGYETMMVLKDALSKENIKNSLINKKFDGLQGELFINKFGDVKRESFLFVVHNREFLEVK